MCLVKNPAGSLHAAVLSIQHIWHEIFLFMDLPLSECVAEPFRVVCLRKRELWVV